LENQIISTSRIDHRAAFLNGQVYLKNENNPALEFLDSLYDHLASPYPKYYKMDNLSKLGFLASEILLKGIDLSASNAEQIGVVLMNANSSLDTDLKYFQSTKEIPSPALFVYTLPNIMIGEICIRNRLKGENAFFISPAFEAAFLAQYVNNLINNNILQYCICGWADLLKDEYEAFLMLVTKASNKDPSVLLFEKENIEKLYRFDHG
jgi:hypothetical protein